MIGRNVLLINDLELAMSVQSSQTRIEVDYCYSACSPVSIVQVLVMLWLVTSSSLLTTLRVIVQDCWCCCCGTCFFPAPRLRYLDD